MTEAWLGGPVAGVPLPLMPAAHALLDAAADLRAAAEPLSVDELWRAPGGAASVAFHLRHVAGSTERLLTYARGLALTPEALAEVAREREPLDPPMDGPALLARLDETVARALDQLRATEPTTLHDERRVGRAGLPSTVQGLLFHAAEHARRHAGQAIATSRILLGMRGSGREARDACLAVLLDAWEDAGVRGLCAEGRWEAAIDAVRRFDP